MDDFDRLLDELVRVGHSPRGKYSAEKSWRLLERRINPKDAYRRRFIGWTLRAAAVFLLAIGSWAVYEYVLPSPMQSIHAEGDIRRFVLPDSSVVLLNRHSSLAYPKRFSRNDRKVTLEGGAYFEVCKETRRPFLVSRHPFQRGCLPGGRTNQGNVAGRLRGGDGLGGGSPASSGGDSCLHPLKQAVGILPRARTRSLHILAGWNIPV